MSGRKLSSPEEISKMAEQALKEVLLLAATAACAECSKPETWTDEAAISIPFAGIFEHLAGGIKKIPLVGRKMAGKLEEAVASIGEAFVDCAVAVCRMQQTSAQFKEAIDTMEISAECVNSPVELCRMGVAMPSQITLFQK
jgi:hypothetical protein